VQLIESLNEQRPNEHKVIISKDFRTPLRKEDKRYRSLLLSACNHFEEIEKFS